MPNWVYLVFILALVALVLWRANSTKRFAIEVKLLALLNIKIEVEGKEGPPSSAGPAGQHVIWASPADKPELPAASRASQEPDPS